MTDDFQGPAAERDVTTAPFFDAAARDQLVIRRCTRCGHHEPPEARSCAECTGVELDWVTASGRARLVTWTVVHHSPHPALADAVPYLAGVVELDEGPWLHTRLRGDPTSLRTGMKLGMSFVHPLHGESLPTFEARCSAT